MQVLPDKDVVRGQARPGPAEHGRSSGRGCGGAASGSGAQRRGLAGGRAGGSRAGRRLRGRGEGPAATPRSCTRRRRLGAAGAEAPGLPPVEAAPRGAMRAAWVLLAALGALAAYYIYLPLPGTVSDSWKLMLLDATFRAVQQTVRKRHRSPSPAPRDRAVLRYPGCPGGELGAASPRPRRGRGRVPGGSWFCPRRAVGRLFTAGIQPPSWLCDGGLPMCCKLFSDPGALGQNN